MFSAALRHLRGNLVAYVALLVALSSTSYAAASKLGPRNSVGTAQVVNGSLQKVDLSSKAVAALRGTRGLRGLRGPAGSQGPQGLPGTQGAPGVQGPKGDPGVQGLRGPSDAFFMFGGSGSLMNGGIPGNPAMLSLPAGRYVAGANAILDNPDAAAFTASCDLEFVTPSEILIDEMDVTLDAGGEVQTVSFAGAFEAQTNGVLLVRCDPSGHPLDYEDYDVFAIRVDTLTQAGAP